MFIAKPTETRFPSSVGAKCVSSICLALGFICRSYGASINKGAAVSINIPSLRDFELARANTAGRCDALSLCQAAELWIRQLASGHAPHAPHAPR